MKISLVAPAIALGLLLPSVAQAHPGLHAAGFADGLAHPFTGLDHLLAMLAVGWWAARAQGSRKWLVPSLFVALFAAGGALGIAGLVLPWLEEALIFSVAALLGFSLVRRELPPWLALPGIALFGLFHGLAHGEVAVSSGGTTFLVGALAGSLLILAIGAGLSLLSPLLAKRTAGR